MEINITDIYNNQQSVSFAYSINGGDEIEDTILRDDFAKLLCEHSDSNESYVDGEVWFQGYVSEDKTAPMSISVKSYIETNITRQHDYCIECLVKHIQSLNKN